MSFPFKHLTLEALGVEAYDHLWLRAHGVHRLLVPQAGGIGKTGVYRVYGGKGTPLDTAKFLEAVGVVIVLRTCRGLGSCVTPIMPRQGSCCLVQVTGRAMKRLPWLWLRVPPGMLACQDGTGPPMILRCFGFPTDMYGLKVSHSRHILGFSAMLHFLGRTSKFHEF